ncbi:MAG: MgtC/SapB family protein [Nanoarchaeota archaeon]|nr:MgtC/SapB family protein [Nanoarchaeota archaeon]
MVELYALLFKIVLALGLGGLIGIERERAHKGYPAGVRTLAFISLIGMLTSFLSEATLNPWIIPFSMATVFILVIVGYGVSLNQQKRFGLTSTVVLFVTYFIGLISYYDDFQYLAVAISIITTLILTEKAVLHNFARKIKSSELMDALKFGIVAFVILPLLPNTEIDPFHVINPYNLWLMVVLILGISFIGYIASKAFGSSKGLYLSGALGGLVSSTAVTSSLSILSRKDKSLIDACAIGITFASSIMFARVLIEAYIVNPSFGIRLAVPLISSMILGLTYSFFKWRTTKNVNSAEFVKTSPFNFRPAIRFTIFLAVILLVSKAANDLIGDAGSYIASVFAGLVDTDAITLSMATLSGSSINYNTGVNSVLLACLTNTIVKLLLSRSVGSKQLFRRLVIVYALMLLPLILFILLSF